MKDQAVREHAIEMPYHKCTLEQSGRTTVLSGSNPALTTLAMLQRSSTAWPHEEVNSTRPITITLHQHAATCVML